MKYIYLEINNTKLIFRSANNSNPQILYTHKLSNTRLAKAKNNINRHKCQFNKPVSPLCH